MNSLSTDRFPSGDVLELDPLLGGLQLLISMSLLAIVVLTLAAGIAMALKRASAAARHLVWLQALLALTVAAVSAPLVPAKFVGLTVSFPANRGVNEPSSEERVASLANVAGPQGASSPAETSRPGPSDASQRRSPWAAGGSPSQPDSQQGPPADSRLRDVVSAHEAPASDRILFGGPRFERWGRFFVWCWLIGATSILALATAGRIALWRRRAGYHAVGDAAMLRASEDAAIELGLRRPVALLQSTEECMPMTWGVIRPSLLLPASADKWSADRMRMVLLHELAHVRRCDCLWQLVALVAAAIHWFNPLVWLAASRLRSECEYACDDLVLRTGVAGSAYAEQLLDISTGGRRGVLSLCAGLGMARSQRLTARLQAIVDPSRNRRAVSRRALAMSVAASGACLLPLCLAAQVRVRATTAPAASQVDPHANPSSHERVLQQRVSAQESTPRQPPSEDENLATPAATLAIGRRRLKAIRFPQPSFAFTRLSFRSSGPGASQRWATDYPEADRAVSRRIAEWTNLKVSAPRVARLTDEGLDQVPFLYLAEPGRLELSDDEVVALRRYLNAGGFLMADDFWGEREWENLRSQIRRAFPALQPVDLPLSHSIFQQPFHFAEKPQVCSIAQAIHGRRNGVTWEREDGKQPHYWGLKSESGRLLAVFCHNTDLADGWERQSVDEWYTREFSEKLAYPMAMNILAFALTQPPRPDDAEWRVFGEIETSVAKLLPDLQVQLNEDRRVASVRKKGEPSFDLTTFGHPVPEGAGYWTSPAMELVGAAALRATGNSDAERMIALLHGVSQGPSFVRQKRYRAHAFGNDYVVEVDHDFQKFPANVMAVRPYEISVDTQGKVTRIRQRSHEYLGSAKVYRKTVSETLALQESVTGGINHYAEALEESLRLAMAKEQGRPPFHNSKHHYPNAIIALKDPESGVSYDVESNGARIFVRNRAGAVVRIVNVVSSLDLKTQAGVPVIRHLALRNGDLVVTIGKHTEVAVDRATGATRFLGAD